MGNPGRTGKISHLRISLKVLPFSVPNKPILLPAVLFHMSFEDTFSTIPEYKVLNRTPHG
jgi:hypothetical protein